MERITRLYGSCPKDLCISVWIRVLFKRRWSQMFTGSLAFFQQWSATALASKRVSTRPARCNTLRPSKNARQRGQSAGLNAISPVQYSTTWPAIKTISSLPVPWLHHRCPISAWTCLRTEVRGSANSECSQIPPTGIILLHNLSEAASPSVVLTLDLITSLCEWLLKTSILEQCNAPLQCRVGIDYHNFSIWM